jgi:hypothetical protein
MSVATRCTDVQPDGDTWVAFCTAAGCHWSAGGCCTEDVAWCIADCHEDGHHMSAAAETRQRRSA